ncbi:stress responsive A/B barrel domain protein [Polyplosphaeria fusca]|uniref:Stress responsive A/B barrel domain protein n=1 Tax=Polyplosphaeria fusca TaxID=682080 RepID=A0A9P4R8D9_9PLEO|nr:stress responsive A/B barrel domain protein [Polyplosphaeria fusca]
MTIHHIVLFKFKDEASTDAIQNACAEMLGLKDRCIHERSNKTYILSAKGGTNNSPENIANGFTHAFVMEFKGAEDRDYYADKDPVHEDSKKGLRNVVDKVQVLDFEDRVFK